jgi:hypothetical protein
MMDTLFKCLSLNSNDRYAGSITVYISDDVIVGLEAHFENHSRMGGVRRGCALNFQLQATEQIAYVWIYAPVEQGYLALALQVSPKNVRASQ